MRTLPALTAIGVTLGLVATAFALTPHRAPAPLPSANPASHHLVVVELYQSQGCSSCPPADAVLNDLAGRDDVLALNFAVTYWDRLGWKDTFAQQVFTDRQWDYARAAQRSEVYTPQMIVDGRIALIGSDTAQVNRALAAASAGSTASIDVAGDSLRIHGVKPAGAVTVWRVRYDPRTLAVPIKAGENDGRTIPHRNIVRALTPLGQWTGAEFTAHLARSNDGLRDAVLVLAGSGGPIVAARKL